MPNVVIYARTSTDAQKQRQTVETQVDACRALLTTRGGSLLGTFCDDGVSGTVALRNRPSGNRLLQLCATGIVDALVVFRLDRLSRRLYGVIEELEAASRKQLEIWSVSEGVVTDLRDAAPGVVEAMRFASMEIDVVTERMSRGRDRVAALGKWTGGPVPFGYDLDQHGHLVPSSREVAGMTEADLARSVFTAMANGSTTIAEARRLQELGVAPGRRYSQRIVLSGSAQWRPSRIRAMVLNPLYAGSHQLKSRFGAITRQVPALIDQTIWNAAKTQMAANMAKTKFKPREYLLRGLVFCAKCDARLAGTTVSNGDWRDFYYRCGSQVGTMELDAAARCRAKSIPADWLERIAWDGCVERDHSAIHATAFAERRKFVERLISRVTVMTERVGRAKSALIVIAWSDGSTTSATIERRPRRDHVN